MHCLILCVYTSPMRFLLMCCAESDAWAQNSSDIMIFMGSVPLALIAQRFRRPMARPLEYSYGRLIGLATWRPCGRQGRDALFFCIQMKKRLKGPIHPAIEINDIRDPLAAVKRVFPVISRTATASGVSQGSFIKPHFRQHHCR